MENLKNGLTMLPLQRRARIACEQCSISKVKCERHDKLDTLSPCDRCVERGYVCASREKARPRGNGHRKQPREAGTGGGASKRRRSEAEAGLPVEGVGSGRRRRSAPSLELSFPYGAAQAAPPLPEPMASHSRPEAEPSTRALYGELTLKPDERLDSAFDSEFDTTIFYPKPMQGWNESFSFNANEPSYHYESVNPQLPSPHSNLSSRTTLGRDDSDGQSISYSELTEAQALYYTPDASSIPRSTASWLPAVASTGTDAHWVASAGAFESLAPTAVPVPSYRSTLRSDAAGSSWRS